MLSKQLSSEDRLYLQDGLLKNLLLAQDDSQGWFVAAPGYRPYGDFVWHRDNAECAMALDMYASFNDEKKVFERSERALLRSFQAVAAKERGVDKLVQIRKKLFNPEFFDDSLHPHCRLRRDGEEVGKPWNNIQYDFMARLLVALSKHIQKAPPHDYSRFEQGVKTVVKYLFGAVWDEVDGSMWLTVCANEWEEKDEPHIAGPLFSSVVGTINSAAENIGVLQSYFNVGEVKEFGEITRNMLHGFFKENESLRMLKRYHERPVGLCSTSLWLFNDFGVFPAASDVFRNTISDIVKSLYVESAFSKSGASHITGGLRRYVIPDLSNGTSAPGFYADGYWGGQAWIITTAQLSRCMAALGEHDAAETLLKNCIETRDSEGKIPEQINGTFIDSRQHENWKVMSGENYPPPWLAWSHAEVLKAYVALFDSL